MPSLGIVALANRVVTTDCDETRPGEPLWPLGHAAVSSGGIACPLMAAMRACRWADTVAAAK